MLEKVFVNLLALYKSLKLTRITKAREKQRNKQVEKSMGHSEKLWLHFEELLAKKENEKHHSWLAVENPLKLALENHQQCLKIEESI